MSCPTWPKSPRNETTQFEIGKRRRMGRAIVKMAAEVWEAGDMDTSSFGPTEKSVETWGALASWFLL